MPWVAGDRPCETRAAEVTDAGAPESFTHQSKSPFLCSQLVRRQLTCIGKSVDLAQLAYLGMGLTMHSHLLISEILPSSPLTPYTLINIEGPESASKSGGEETSALKYRIEKAMHMCQHFQ